LLIFERRSHHEAIGRVALGRRTEGDDVSVSSRIVVVIRCGRGAGIRRPGDGEESVTVAAEAERLQLLIPLTVGVAHARRPHPRYIGDKRRLYCDGIEAVDLNGDDGSALVHRGEPGRARGEAVVDVVNGDGFWANRDGSWQHAAVEKNVANPELQFEVAEELQGINPGFEDAVFVAEQSSARADGVEKLPVTRGASKRHTAGLAAVGLGEQRGSEGETEGEGHEKRSEAHRFAMLEESGSRGNSG